MMSITPYKKLALLSAVVILVTQVIACSRNKVPYLPQDTPKDTSQDESKIPNPRPVPTSSPTTHTSPTPAPTPTPTLKPLAPATGCASPAPSKIAENSSTTGIDVHWSSPNEKNFNFFNLYECKPTNDLPPVISKCQQLYSIFCEATQCRAFTPDEIKEATYPQGNVTLTQENQTEIAYRFVDTTMKITPGDVIAWVPFCN